MRVLYIADPFLPVPPRLYGGIERIVASTIQGALNAGHEVTLLAHPESVLLGADVRPLAGGMRLHWDDLLANLGRVKKAVRDFRPHLVHSFARLAYLLPILRSPLPKIMSFQRKPVAHTVRWAARLGGPRLTFAGCSEWITRLGSALGGNWETIPNGIDLAHYRFQSHVASEAPLVFLSRLERVKGPHLAIAAARAAGRKLILAGDHATSGPEGDYWKREIAPHLGRDGILYVGPLDDAQKSELLGRALALLVPIEWDEPFGLVFVEALACGTPVIAQPRGALPEIIEHGREGFLARDGAELQDAIARVHQLDRAACRRKAERHFPAKLMCERYDELYRRVTSAESAGRHFSKEEMAWIGYNLLALGRVAERLNAADLKSALPSRVTWVRILPRPSGHGFWAAGR